jgi:hypothetical protein
MARGDKPTREPDLILPSQFAGTLRRDAPIKQGEHQLLIAMLEDAVHCYQKYLHATNKKDRQTFREAEQWIMAHDTPAPQRGANKTPGFSFENVCDVLGISPDYVRTGLRRWREAQRLAAEKDGCKV